MFEKGKAFSILWGPVPGFLVLYWISPGENPVQSMINSVFAGKKQWIPFLYAM
jgi:hypothetical protein